MKPSSWSLEFECTDALAGVLQPMLPHGAVMHRSPISPKATLVVPSSGWSALPALRRVLRDEGLELAESGGPGGETTEELRDATVRLSRLDYALKGGSRLAPELELQLAITDLAREPR